jgi:hypothetical protein
MTFVSDDLDDDVNDWYEQKICPHGYIGNCVWCQRTEQVADGRTRLQRQEDHRRSVQK